MRLNGNQVTIKLRNISKLLTKTGATRPASIMMTNPIKKTAVIMRRENTKFLVIDPGEWNKSQGTQKGMQDECCFHRKYQGAYAHNTTATGPFDSSKD